VHADGLATTAELLTVISRTRLAGLVKAGKLIRVCRGVYAYGEPDVLGKLAVQDLLVGQPVVACMGTAAALYGFDTESTSRVHVLDPGIRMRPSNGLMVHQRIGAPLRRVDGRRSRGVANGERGAPGVIDSGLPMPELQCSVADRYGRLWRVDFAWPAAMVVAEYDSLEWHMGRDALLHDRLKTARLQECGWTAIPMTVDDIRGDPIGLVARINTHLLRPRLAG
jgi:hypothetical protein